MSKTAAILWPLPEWAHVMLAVYFGSVPALVHEGNYVLGYLWVRFRKAVA